MTCFVIKWPKGAFTRKKKPFKDWALRHFTSHQGSLGDKCSLRLCPPTPSPASTRESNNVVTHMLTHHISQSIKMLQSTTLHKGEHNSVSLSASAFNKMLFIRLERFGPGLRCWNLHWNIYVSLATCHGYIPRLLPSAFLWAGDGHQQCQWVWSRY